MFEKKSFSFVYLQCYTDSSFKQAVYYITSIKITIKINWLKTQKNEKMETLHILRDLTSLNENPNCFCKSLNSFRGMGKTVIVFFYPQTFQNDPLLFSVCKVRKSTPWLHSLHPIFKSLILFSICLNRCLSLCFLLSSLPLPLLCFHILFCAGCSVSLQVIHVHCSCTAFSALLFGTSQMAS